MNKLSFKTVGLPCGKEGPTPLYTANLFNGICPHMCAYCYATNLKGYTNQTPEPVTLENVKNVTKWPRRLFLSSSSDPFHPIVIKVAEHVIKDALSNGTFLVISTKALATNNILKALSNNVDQVSYTISLSSMDPMRNEALEPQAPTAEERLNGKKSENGESLVGVKQLVECGVNVTLKVDTIFPGIDDTDESLSNLLSSAKACGVTSVNFSYAFYRKNFKSRLEEIPFLNDSLLKMTEYQSIASGKGYSLPLAEKALRLSHMVNIAEELGFLKVTVCKCKNQIGSISGCKNIVLDCHFHNKWF